MSWQKRLQKILSQNYGAREYTLEKLKGDASTREYFRIDLKDKEIEGKGSAVLALSQNPVPFVNILKFLKRCGVDVPRLYFHDKEVLILEDFGDTTLEERMRGKDREAFRKYYKKAIDSLLKFQIEGMRNRDDRCLAFSRAFDREKFLAEFDFSIKYLAPIMEERNKRILRKEFLEIAEMLDKEPKYLTHRDYHSRNIMVQDDGLKILDFQDARLGLLQFDLASLLRDSYLVLDEELVEELIAYYLDRLNKVHGIREEAHFRYIFDLTSIVRNLKSASVFVYLDRIKKNDHYLRYIPDTLAYVKKNLTKYRELKGIQKILKKYIGGIG